MPVSISAIICDDIRQEITGKLFLIGAYPLDMGVSSFPIEKTFDCLLKFYGLPVDASSMTLTINHIGYKAEKSTYDFPPIVDGRTTMAIFGFPIKARSAGTFTLDVSIDGGRRRKVESLLIEAEATVDQM